MATINKKSLVDSISKWKENFSNIRLMSRRNLRLRCNVRPSFSRPRAAVPAYRHCLLLDTPGTIVGVGKAGWRRKGKVEPSLSHLLPSLENL